MITNYGTLKTELAATSHRADMTARIPYFVQRAESMIASRVRCQENRTTGAIVEADRLDGSVFQLPADCVEVVDIYDGTARLVRRGPAELYQFANSGSIHSYTLFAVTRHSADFRGSVETDHIGLIVEYFKRFAAFSGDADTNSLLTTQPELYLNGALHWLYLDTHDIEMSGVHRDMFEADVERLNRAYQRASRAQSTAALANVRHGSDY